MAFQPFLLPLNVKAQPEGPAVQSETVIGRVSSTGGLISDISHEKCGVPQTDGAHLVSIQRHSYYFEVSAPIVALICSFTLRQLLLMLLSLPYRLRINLNVLAFNVKNIKNFQIKSHCCHFAECGGTCDR